MTPAARRAELVRAYHSSGMTLAAFARRERLSYSTFAGWVAAITPPPVQFAQMRLPVSPTPAPSHETASLEVRLPDGTLMRGSNVNELAALARALRA